MQINGKKCPKVSKKKDFIVSVLLSAHAEIVGVSRMQDFYYRIVEFTVMSAITGPNGRFDCPKMMKYFTTGWPHEVL